MCCKKLRIVDTTHILITYIYLQEAIEKSHQRKLSVNCLLFVFDRLRTPCLFSQNNHTSLKLSTSKNSPKN